MAGVVLLCGDDKRIVQFFLLPARFLLDCHKCIVSSLSLRAGQCKAGVEILTQHAGSPLFITSCCVGFGPTAQPCCSDCPHSISCHHFPDYWLWQTQTLSHPLSVTPSHTYLTHMNLFIYLCFLSISCLSGGTNALHADQFDSPSQWYAISNDHATVSLFRK